MKFRGKYIDKDGLKYIVGENEEVEIQEEVSTASIKGQYIIWESLEKFVGNNEEDIWVKVFPLK
ncbi:hypothetical protein [Siminovitchia fordii]|uniref:Uncharacterized protein n=1 Tax=Siminovitchia fordii TaxID=254759 RepID=A0ABQ4KA58_9BACI|nr:hypothetical protein [Siminovitchia fordii]GIN22604.1 hypothetical protein J1TS3_37380 [Siminovitchia fordii]